MEIALRLVEEAEEVINPVLIRVQSNRFQGFNYERVSGWDMIRSLIIQRDIDKVIKNNLKKGIIGSGVVGAVTGGVIGVGIGIGGDEIIKKVIATKKTSHKSRKRTTR